MAAREDRRSLARSEAVTDLCARLKARKRTFHVRRSGNTVVVDVDGSTVGDIRVDDCSANVGLGFKVRHAHGGLIMPVVYAKKDQRQRKKVAVLCAYLMYLHDTRPSEERRESPITQSSDPKVWFDLFDHSRKAEITDTHDVVSRVFDANRTVIDLFGLIDEAMKSACGEDVDEAVERVRKELPFLVGRITVDDWVALYNRTLVEQVHES